MQRFSHIKSKVDCWNRKYIDKIKFPDFDFGESFKYSIEKSFKKIFKKYKIRYP